MGWERKQKKTVECAPLLQNTSLKAMFLPLCFRPPPRCVFRTLVDPHTALRWCYALMPSFSICSTSEFLPSAEPAFRALFAVRLGGLGSDVTFPGRAPILPSPSQVRENQAHRGQARKQEGSCVLFYIFGLLWRVANLAQRPVYVGRVFCRPSFISSFLFMQSSVLSAADTHAFCFSSSSGYVEVSPFRTALPSWGTKYLELESNICSCALQY